MVAVKPRAVIEFGKYPRPHTGLYFREFLTLMFRILDGEMKAFVEVLLFVFVILMAALIYVLDHWLGIVAYTIPYLLFSAVISLVSGTIWFAIRNRNSVWIGLAVFAIFGMVIVLSPSSERILRSSMLSIKPGTNSSEIENVVAAKYGGTRFVMPLISRESERVHVSLISQKAGNCSSVIFHIQDGVVVDRKFIAD